MTMYNCCTVCSRAFGFIMIHDRFRIRSLADRCDLVVGPCVEESEDSWRASNAGEFSFAKGESVIGAQAIMTITYRFALLAHEPMNPR
jgi:hypothetical protein